MREKLLDLMKNEGLKPSQLAEMLEINPAGVSHILAGRNKPGFDLLQKILRRFPQINPDWLLLDSPKMYRDTPATQIAGIADSPAPSSPTSDGDLFRQTASPTIRTSESHPAENTQQAEVGTMSAAELMAIKGATTSNVERVVLFYDDHTFEHFTLKH